MTPQEYEQFVTVIADVHEFYKQPLSEFSLTVWWEAMRQYDLSAVSDALGRHVVNPDTGQFMPKPADVVRMLDGGTQDSALLAWAKVKSAIARVGPYETVAFDDPLIHACLEELGGWPKLCSTPTEKDLEFRGNEFVKRYRGYRMRSATPEYLRSLAGLNEQRNNQIGVETPVKLIGDADAARRVVDAGTKTPGLTVTTAADLATTAIESRREPAQIEHREEKTA